VVAEPLAVDVRSPTSNGVLSPSSGPSSIGWDSRTPLIQMSNSPALSVNSLGGATDTTELDNYPLDSPEAAPLSKSHYTILRA